MLGCESSLSLPLHLGLPRALRCLEAFDLAADRAQHLLSRCELLLNRLPGRCPLRHELGLPGACSVQSPLPQRCLALEPLDAANHGRVLLGDTILRVDPAQDAVEVVGPQQNLER